MPKPTMIPPARAAMIAAARRAWQDAFTAQKSAYAAMCAARKDDAAYLAAFRVWMQARCCQERAWAAYDAAIKAR